RRTDLQIRNLRQTKNQRFRKAVRQVISVGVGAFVFKRQDSDGIYLLSGWREIFVREESAEKNDQSKQAEQPPFRFRTSGFGIRMGRLLGERFDIDVFTCCVWQAQE